MRANRSSASRAVANAFDGVPAHIANSAATLSLPTARFDAVRCGVALYGLSPFGDDPARHGLDPVLSWRSYVAVVKTLQAGESAGYGRAFIAEGPTRIGVVPVGYGDGFRRGLSGTEVLVDGARRRLVGAVSMDALTVELEDEEPGRARDSDRRRDPRGGARSRPRHDQLRDHVRNPRRSLAGRPEGARWMSAFGTAVAGVEAYVVGGAVRDELLGRQIVDVDVATADPEVAARIYAGMAKGALFPLSERHGAWRVAFRDGRTVDFTPLRGTLEDDLRTRDFTLNAIARPVSGAGLIDPLGGQADLAARTLRAVGATIFEDDPLRLLRAVRLEEELGCRRSTRGPRRLVREHAGLVAAPRRRAHSRGARASHARAAFGRADELGLLRPLGGSLRPPREGRPRRLARLPARRRLRREALRSPDLERAEAIREDAARSMHARKTSLPRAIFRFRKATEPWALSVLAFLGATDLYDAVRAARAADPAQELLRGEDILALGVQPGPEVGRLLDLVAEEQAAGTISTREQALELVQRELELRAPLDRAADRRCLRRFGLPAGERRLERSPQVGLGPVRVRVIRVGRAVIDEAVLGVEEEHLRRAGGAVYACATSWLSS